MIKNVKQFLFIAGLLMIAAGAQPVGAAFWQWSTIASNNSTADPSINWSEGMSPSSVNDSARAMMAALAVQAKDISGSLSSAGTTSAITVTTNTNFPALANLNGQKITFLHTLAGNVGGATLNIDGTGAVPLYSSTGAPVATDQMQIGGVYTVTYYSSVGQYRLHATFNDPYNVPLGGIVWSTISTPPNANFIVPAGQCISTTTYNTYWVAMGSPPNGSCPGGQFAVIDMAGRVPAALDTLPGFSAKNRLTSSSTGCGTAMTSVGAVCANGVEAWTLTSTQMPSHFHSASISDPTHSHTYDRTNLSGNGATGGGGNNSISLGTPFTSSGTIAAATGVRVNSSNGLDTTNSTGGGGAHPSVQPTIGLIPYMRVL